MNYDKYLNVVSGNFKKAVKVEWLNPDESVNFEFTNSLYDINVDLSVNYQNGSRRTCTLTLNNDKNQFPINFNNIWFGQKFKLWMGVYIDDETPYYLPQGVFYISNPDEVYQPNSRTIKINGVDKWAALDGTLNGVLSGTHQTSIGVDLFKATRGLLGSASTNDWLENYFIVENGEYYFEYTGGEYVSNNKGENSTTAKTVLTARYDMKVSFDYAWSSENNRDHFILTIGGEQIVHGNGIVDEPKSYSNEILTGQQIIFEYSKDKSSSEGDDCAKFYNLSVECEYVSEGIDPIPPFISPSFLNKTVYILNTDDSKNYSKTYYYYEDGEYKEWDTKDGSWTNDWSTLYYPTEVWKCPYTVKVERGKTYADILLEYATILCAHIYYDANGRLTIEPMTDTADDITDTNKEVLWNYSTEEKSFLGLSQTYNLSKVYNDIIVLGNIVNGYQFKARVQNKNLMSDTCIQKIGLKTKEPLEDNQYYSDEQCKELAMYHAKVDTIMQKSGSISSTPLYHLDVNKLVTVSTPNNNMSKELFLISGYTLNSSESMSINVTSVNVLKDFSVVEAKVYE